MEIINYEALIRAAAVRTEILAFFSQFVPILNLVAFCVLLFFVIKFFWLEMIGIVLGIIIIVFVFEWYIRDFGKQLHQEHLKTCKICK